MTQFTFPADLGQFTGQFIQNGNGIFIAEDGSIGLGTIHPVNPVDIEHTFDVSEDANIDCVAIELVSSGPNSNDRFWYEGLGIYLTNNALSSGSGHNEIFASYSFVVNNGDCSLMVGHEVQTMHSAVNVLDTSYGIVGWFAAYAGGIITKCYGMAFGIRASGSGSEVIDGYGAYVYSDNLYGGIINNMYGLFIDYLSGISKWGIYVNDPAPNYLAGSLGLGVINPTTKLDINGSVNLAAGNTYNIDGVPHTHDNINGSPSNLGEIIAMAVALG
jgi:hypothetical protein